MPLFDPALFRPDAVSPETAAFNARLETTLAALPPTHEVPVELSRKAREEGRGIFPPQGPLEGSEWREPAPGLRLRVSLPAGEPTGVYIHIHGGGWALGAPEQNDARCQGIAAATGMAVVSVKYRLAPENPWPAGPDDCLRAAVWVIENAAAEFGTDRVAIGGESAGGHLSAVTLLRLKAEGMLDRIAGAALVYGAFDMRLTRSSRDWGPRNMVLSTPTITWFSQMFTPNPQDREDPLASPLLGDLTGMPPALFQIGTMDPLMDDTLQMAARWAGAGSAAELRVYPGGVHAFDAFTELSLARAAIADQHAFLNRLLG